MPRRFLIGCALGLWLLLRSAPCAAQPVRELGFDLRRDLALAGSLLGLNVVAEFAWPAPDEPRWTRVSDFDLRAAAALGAAQPARADRTSDALLGLVMVGGPALAFFGPAWADRDQWPRRGLEDFVILSEAALSAGLSAQIIKKSTARIRPALHFQAEAGEGGGVIIPPGLRDSQRFTSFYSGHASLTASIGAALVTLSYLRGYGYRHAALALFAALSLATGGLRIVAGWHWTSDVIAGWAIGTAFGAGVPLLHELVSGRRRARGAPRAGVRVGPGPDLQLAWAF
jgi:membrane-associated phospholipid phosphatase